MARFLILNNVRAYKRREDATGYPLAFVAAKLGLGYGLFELKNSVTKIDKWILQIVVRIVLKVVFLKGRKGVKLGVILKKMEVE